jgi:hypothetical protein
MGTICEGGRLSWASHRSGECIGSGDVVMSFVKMFLGYCSMTETDAEEMEELE